MNETFLNIISVVSGSSHSKFTIGSFVLYILIKVEFFTCKFPFWWLLSIQLIAPRPKCASSKIRLFKYIVVGKEYENYEFVCVCV